MLIDCFPFYSELELLEIRLETLAPVVDGFVLIEAPETYSGKPKPLVFDQNRARFQRFNIHAVTIPTFPTSMTDPWQREVYTRNRLAEGLEALSLAPDDLVLLSDLDEIPRPEAVARVAEALPHEPPGTCYVFQQELSYYFVNCKSTEPWQGTRMTRAKDIGTMADLRSRQGIGIRDGDWHFSYLGGVARIQEKIEASVHTELDRPEHKEADHLARCLREGVDLFGRNLPLRLVPFDGATEGSYPSFLVDNRERFAHLIQPCRDTAPAERLFREAVGTPSDIDQHLSYLYRLASTVNHVTELGTRNGLSTSAFLYAQPEHLITYDLERSSALPRLEAAARACGVAFEFRQEDVLTTEIEPTDLLFIDTWHVEPQMRAELGRHADKARRYLVLHDTETFGQVGESGGHGGIWPAVAAFMKAHPHWHLLQHFPHNNGLTVFVRF